MKTCGLLLLAASGAFIAGCASPGSQVASADDECRIAPAYTVNSANPTSRREPTELERRAAESKLASTSYYRQSLQNRPENSTVVLARRECN